MHFKNKEIQLQYQGFCETKPLWINTLYKQTQNTDYQYNYISLFKVKNQLQLRLGKLVEQFVFYQISENENIEILIENLQIQDDKLTIGELDCILLDNGKPTHLEIIYKFYLYDATVGNEEIEHWIGPNRRDSFDLKYNKLIHKQLPLLYHEKTKEVLKEYNLDVNDIEQKVYFKAQLFTHLKERNTVFPLINNECIEGFYIHERELEEFKADKFFIPTKLNWLVKPHAHVDWLNFEDFKGRLHTFLQKENSPLCWLKQTNGELHKFFVVWW